MTEPHILLVDDERDIRDPLAAYLGRNAMRVTKAENAAAARQILAAHAIDLILLDIMMPGEDGLSLAGFVRATSGIPVILLTAKAEDMDRIIGLELGADDYVTKPFNPRELLARITAVLRRTAGGGKPVHAHGADAYAFGPWVPRSLIGQKALLSGAALLIAQLANYARILNERQKLSLAQNQGPAITRYVSVASDLSQARRN